MTLHQHSSHEIARIRVQAEQQNLAIVLQFIRSVITPVLPDAIDVNWMTLAVEEACLNVIQHAFEPDETGVFELAVETPPGMLVIAVEDNGIPFYPEMILNPGTDTQQDTAIQGLGARLIRGAVDETVYLNLGNRGKRLELIKKLPAPDMADLADSQADKSANQSTDCFPDDLIITLRLLKPDIQDATALSRCIYRSYGYSYVGDFLYYPEQICDHIQRGIMISCVAETAKGEIVGHLSLTLQEPDAKVGETGQAVVDPRARGRSLFKKMKSHLSELATTRGMYGFYSESVTIHPYTQKGNLKIGAHETGFLLCFIPESLFFKKIEQGNQSDHPEHGRQTALLYYLRITEEPSREVYLPDHHQQIIKDIYQENRLVRTACKIDASQINPVDISAVDVRVRANWGQAIIQVKQVGQDLQKIVRHHLMQLVQSNIVAIYADLSLCDPNTPAAVNELEKLGFFFSGIVPELYNGDILRLQYLNYADFDPDAIVLVSDFAKQLYNYVLTEKNRVTTPLT